MQIEEILHILTYILTYTLIGAAFLAMLLVPVELSAEFIRKRSEYKAEHKEIEHNIRVWTSIAKSCDPVEDAYDKGYAIARLVIYHHELEELENDRKRELCS